jgi:predicted NACHT family NTPase
VPQLPEKSIDELVQEVRSRCCDKIQHLYSKIQLLNRQQIDVDQLYVDVYVLEKLASESYATIPDLLKGSDLRDGFDRLGLGKREKRSPGFEVAAKYSRLMVLGKPGSGKTTFLRHLAVAACKGEFLADHIPILIELRDINAGVFNLLNYIHQEFDLADEEQTKEILKQGKVLILLDGLDEVPGQSMREVQDHIYKFSQFQHYYKNRFILTCRTQTIEYISDKFKPVEVADFNPEQVEIFAQNWFTALAETPEQGAELTVKFLDKLRLPENKPTAELAVTPILLSLTCWVFNDLKDLPPKRSDLYEQGINLLLEKWDEKRGVRRELGSEVYRKLSIGEKKKLLSYVAARKFEQEQYVLYEQGEIQGYIAEYLRISIEDSETVLNAVEAQHGLLIKRAQEFWSFSHLTFQEYFTAKWFCDRADWQSFVIHATEIHWREVFLLAVEIMQSVEELVQLLKLHIDQFLASESELQELLKWTSQKSFSLPVNYKPAAFRAFHLEAAESSAFVNKAAAFALDHTLALDFCLDYAIDADVNPILDLVLGLDDDRAESFAQALELSQTIEPQLYILLKKHITQLLNITNNSDSKINYTSGFKPYQPVQKLIAELLKLDSLVEQDRIHYFNLSYALVGRIAPIFTSIPESYQPLQNLISKLLKLDTDKYMKIHECWVKNNSYIWKAKVKALIEHRNSELHKLRFDSRQKKLLKQYYHANDLLVKCLHSQCKISSSVKEDIEETLLLPIDEIKKRQQ